MSQIITQAVALLPSIAIGVVAVLGALSGIDKALETLSTVLTGKPQAAVKDADSFVESAIGVLQAISSCLAPRKSAAATVAVAQDVIQAVVAKK